MKVFISTALVPREQHIAWATGLLSCLESSNHIISRVYVTGQFYDSPTMKMLLEQFGNLLIHECHEVLPVAEARVRQFQYFQKWPRLWEERDQVLFLDDDAVLTPAVLNDLAAKSGWRTGVIGLQSSMVPNFELLRGQPSFDFFCSLIPVRAALEAGEDKELMRLMVKHKFAEQYLLDWWLRNKGMMFNIVTTGMLHLTIPDKFKYWFTTSWESWDQLYRKLYNCRSLEEVDKAFSEHEWA